METRSKNALRHVLVCAVAAYTLQFAATVRGDESVSLLDAQRDGSLTVVARGHGANQVRFTITNKSARRLNIVIPPGLVAAAPVTQGFQSMGLGGLTDQPGRFGRYPSQSTAGFRSLGLEGVPDSLALSAGQTTEILMPSVCLNFGIPTPTAKNVFTLKDVSEYTNDPRAIKALRSLANLGTGQGVAQAVAWHVFNSMSFEQIASEGHDYVNKGEVSLAARFVEALDLASAHDSVDPSYVREGRILVRLQGESSMGKVSSRLIEELNGQKLLGLPVQTVGERIAGQTHPATLLIDSKILGQGERSNQTRVRISLQYHSAVGGWTKLAALEMQVSASPTEISASAFVAELDRAIVRSLVTVTPARRSDGTTTLKVVNRLPFSIQSLALRTGQDDNAPEIFVDALGIAPGRSAMVTVPAVNGFPERALTNGL